MQPGVGDMVQERLRRAAGVGAHQHLATLGLGQLLQRGVSTPMWSALLNGEALPGRRSRARVSPVPCSPWSTKAHIGANP